MKKVIFPLFLAVLTFASCGEDTEGESNEANGNEVVETAGHLITGELANADGLSAMLVVFEDKAERLVDSVVIENGRFEITTDTKELRQYVLLIGSEEMPIILLLDENAENVTIKGEVPGVGENYAITGSQESQYVKDYLMFLKPNFDRKEEIGNEMRLIPPGSDPEKVEAYKAVWDSISLVQRDYAVAFIDENPGSPASWLMLRELYPQTDLESYDTTDLAYFEKVASAMKERYPYSEYPDLIAADAQSLKSQIEIMNNPELAAGNGTGTFEYAPEIVMNDQNGKELALSSLRGNIVLIDFWASWCGPCRKENPNVVKMYEKYKDKGFTVFSVSLDDRKEAWLQAIQTDNLSWPNHVSDLNGWQSSAAVSYGVNAIPATFLIDGEGKVIGTNLRGPALERKLQEVLG